MYSLLSDALAARGYDVLTDVQKAVTDPALGQSDLLVSAQTGSGKTVGFGLAIAPTLLDGDAPLSAAGQPMALVVAPTRELALQVMRELRWLYEKADAKVVSCVGGMDMRDERRALDRGAHIVVGTPGRLRDHIMRGSLDMSALRAIVLDEADEMLDLGFREDLEFMLDQAPEERRILLFSATVPPQIAKLAKQFQRDAVRISTVSAASQHADISYQALRVAQSDTENAIINMLRYHDAQNALVFANTRAAVNRLAARFANRGFATVSLSGELSQTERTHALQAMRDGRARVCVATDVAARGIDLPNLELVIHAELPTNAESLLHRSGRTGRAGRKGISALIVPPKVTKKAERLLQFAKISAEWTVPPSADDILARDEERLLADPVWTEDMSGAQSAFAGKLLELHSPQQIAAAYLKLYQSRQSAPEDLSAPDAKPERRERGSFGPSTWFQLSVGRDNGAEPRWLLPLVCRIGDFTKEAIGAIRVQGKISYVEIAQPNVAAFVAGLGENGALDEEVSATKLDKAPDVSGPPPRSGGGPRPGNDRRPAGPRPSKPDYKPRADSDHKPRGDKPRYDDKPKGDKPRYDDKPKGAPKPRYDDKAPRDDAPARKPQGAGKPAYDKKPPYDKKPRKDKDSAPPKRIKNQAERDGAVERKPSGFKAGAADPSKPMARPGRAKGKPYSAKPGAGKGGPHKGGPGKGGAPKGGAGPKRGFKKP